MENQKTVDERLAENLQQLCQVLSMIQTHGIKSPEFKAFRKKVNLENRALMKEIKERNGGKMPRLRFQDSILNSLIS